MPNMNGYVFLFDSDWVINPFPTKKFSDRIIIDYPESLKILDFFNDWTYSKCKKWELLLEIAFPKYLEWTIFEWKLDKILDYWHEWDNWLDEKILSIISKLRTKWYKIYLWTNQANTRTHYMINKINIWMYFDKIITSCNIKATKPEKEFFRKTFDIINKWQKKFKKEQIIFFDDKEENIESWNEFWFESYLYKSIEDLKSVLKNKKIII